MTTEKLVFGKQNYIIMIIGFVLVLLGLLLMTMDNEEYGFGTLGITVGPLVLCLGFAVEFVAILYKKK